MPADHHLDRTDSDAADTGDTTVSHSDAHAAGRSSWVVVGLVMLAFTLIWVLLVPPGGGADEPSHLYRSAALIRDTPGRDAGFESRELYLLSDWIEIPEPACYAFKPGVSAACAPVLDRTGALVEVFTRADEYPPGAHVVYGVATLVPGVAAVWPARLIGALVISALLAGSYLLRQRRGALAAAGLFVALTPMAWGTFATVNPSAFTIAGATALWTALIELALQRRARSNGESESVVAADRPTAWLLTAGWVACVLPRRDGTIWACLIVATIIIAFDLPIASILRAIGRLPAVVVTATLLAMTVWAATDDSPVTRLMAIAPVALVAAEAVRWWRSRATTTVGRWLPIAATVVGTIVAFAITAVGRRGGADAELTWKIVAETPRHLREAIGVLGWLDAPIPIAAVWGWVLLVVVALWGAARDRDKRFVVTALVTLAVALVSSWMLELASGADTGRYWQGRYSLPILVGVALLATSASPGRAWQRREAAVLSIGALGLLNVAAWSVSRRWAVGVEGPLLPTDWPATLLPLRPVVPLLALALVSLTMLRIIAQRWGRSAPR